ncbi:MAG: hypothetical protein N0C84_00490 [Candidatus Thiodiazotropha taylori]|uniref:Uncharacterized protein n=1 Tax=Candidatus Thiodiazotropha taylori TaxID=2792791 RepID=A0A9E4K9Y6_9GAMM|nr:hypothetical protein [Candidatus Thiodiazotropha taylori]MCW4254922.1 hypothetical protein [Candidatus Thiodiazotropha taylori]
MFKKLITATVLAATAASVQATDIPEGTITAIWAQETKWTREDGRDFFVYARVHNEDRNWKIDFPIFDPTCTKGRTDFKQKVKVNGKNITIAGGCIDDDWFGLVPKKEDQQYIFNQFFKKNYVTMVVDGEQTFKWLAKGVVRAVRTSQKKK